jgi:glutathione S-transferase
MARPLKLYNHAGAPNPRRVRIFAAEKGIELSLEEVDILAGRSRTPEFLAKNSSGGVQVLEFDDGSYLSESVAICRYLEGLYPEPNLWGAISANRRRSRGGTGGWSWNCSPPSDARFKIPIRSLSNSRTTSKLSVPSFISASNGWIAS